tara:strand:- start:234 stop:416 length:183 start_codon:yes stop_codon:yes gene_type:complete
MEKNPAPSEAGAFLMEQGYKLFSLVVAHLLVLIKGSLAHLLGWPTFAILLRRLLSIGGRG